MPALANQSKPFVVTGDKGLALSSFNSVDIDCDLFVPADCMLVDGPSTNLGLPIPFKQVRKTKVITATLGPALLFAGDRQSAQKERSNETSSLQVEVVSPVKTLVDCAPPAGFKKPGGSLAAFATELCAQFGIKVICAGGANIPRQHGIAANAAEPVWSLLEGLARQVGAWIWADPAGVVHIQELAPFYAKTPIGKLVHIPGATGNNILSYRLRDDVAERFSHVTVVGQGSARALDGNLAAGTTLYTVEGKAIDAEMIATGYFRPLVIADGRARSINQALAAAEREMRMRRVNGTKIEVVVAGWQSDLGKPWQITDMITLTLKEEMIAGPHMIAGRRFTRSIKEGERTRLTLIEPGIL